MNCDPAEFIRETIKPNVDVSHEDVRQQRHVIPALVPPLKLKPILSHKYIDLWANAAKWIKEAKHIVVLGYSFNNADEHFNDILRCNSDRKIDVVVPEATSDYFKGRMEKVFNTPTSQLDTITIQGKKALQARNLRLIPAKAAEIDISALFQNGNNGK